MYNFDLRTPDSAYDFLLTFFNMSGQEYIEELIINSDIEFASAGAKYMGYHNINLKGHLHIHYEG